MQNLCYIWDGVLCSTDNNWALNFVTKRSISDTAKVLEQPLHNFKIKIRLNTSELHPYPHVWGHVCKYQTLCSEKVMIEHKLL